MSFENQSADSMCDKGQVMHVETPNSGTTGLQSYLLVPVKRLIVENHTKFSSTISASCVSIVGPVLIHFCRSIDREILFLDPRISCFSLVVCLCGAISSARRSGGLSRSGWVRAEACSRARADGGGQDQLDLENGISIWK